MLSAAPAAEVVPGDQDTRAHVRRVVEDKVIPVLGNIWADLCHLLGIQVPELGESGEAEACPLDRLEELRTSEVSRMSETGV